MIQRLGREYRDQTVECLVSAFKDDKVFAMFFPGDEEERLRQMRVMFGTGCDARYLRGNLPICVMEGETVVGVSWIVPPGEKKDDPEVEALWESVVPEFAEGTMERFEQYSDAKKRQSPEYPHHYLDAIAVRSDRQGQGVGGELLEHLFAMAEDDPASQGLVLDTNSDSNIRFYTKHGFAITGEEQIEGYRAVWMSRSCV